MAIRHTAKDLAVYVIEILYKQKIWLEKYLAKSITNHFDEIKFGGSRVTLYNKTPLNLQLVN